MHLTSKIAGEKNRTNTRLRQRLIADECRDLPTAIRLYQPVITADRPKWHKHSDALQNTRRSKHVEGVGTAAWTSLDRSK